MNKIKGKTPEYKVSTTLRKQFEEEKKVYDCSFGSVDRAYIQWLESNQVHGWQKCPVCDGQGRVLSENKQRFIIKNCATCNGKRIISTITGKPPEDD